MSRPSASLVSAPAVLSQPSHTSVGSGFAASDNARSSRGGPEETRRTGKPCPELATAYPPQGSRRRAVGPTDSAPGPTDSSCTAETKAKGVNQA